MIQKIQTLQRRLIQKTEEVNKLQFSYRTEGGDCICALLYVFEKRVIPKILALTCHHITTRLLITMFETGCLEFVITKFQCYNFVMPRLLQTIAMDTPGGNLSFVRNIKAQTRALNRAIT